MTPEEYWGIVGDLVTKSPDILRRYGVMRDVRFDVEYPDPDDESVVVAHLAVLVADKMCECERDE